MAMPAYAQAVTSTVEDLFRNSNLMVGDFGKASSSQTYDRYAFYAGLHNRVVVARKHKTKISFFSQVQYSHIRIKLETHHLKQMRLLPLVVRLLRQRQIFQMNY